MKDVSGVRWAVQGGHVGLYGPLLGRQDAVATPESFSPTPGNTPDVAPEEVPDLGRLESPEPGLAELRRVDGRRLDRR